MAGARGGTGRQGEQRAGRFRKCALALAVGAVLAACAAVPPSVAAVGSLGSFDLVSRNDGRVLLVYPKDGRNWVIGTPGQEYSVRVCNRTGGRMLTVISVDGVNVITG